MGQITKDLVTVGTFTQLTYSFISSSRSCPSVTGYLVSTLDSKAFGLAIAKILGTHEGEVLKIKANSRLKA